jgi:DNA-binding transcriptional regulator GbsR (MarR family)
MKQMEEKFRDIVGETGKLLEKFGLTPMQGRIVAYLTVCEPPEKTFEDILKFFTVSKSSVSNSINYLLQARILDYKIYPNDRKRYFFITDLFLKIYFEKILENINEFRSQANRIVKLKIPRDPVVTKKLLKWIEDANLSGKKLSETLNLIKNEY